MLTFIIIVWFLLAIIELIAYLPIFRKLDNAAVITLFMLILIVGSPIFIINNIFALILNSFMPEGWDDDDDTT